MSGGIVGIVAGVVVLGGFFIWGIMHFRRQEPLGVGDE